MATIIEDQGNNPLLNNNFLLRVDAVYDLPCFKISGFRNEKEFEKIQAGGVNDYVYLRQKPITKPLTFEIERYVGKDFFDPLKVGKQPVLPIILYVSRYINDFNDPKLTFYFTGCTVMNKQYGELNAERSGLMVEKTTIAYQQVYLYSSSNDDPQVTWSFDPTGRNYLGQGKRKATTNSDEMRRKDMEAASRKWPQVRSARTMDNLVR